MAKLNGDRRDITALLIAWGAGDQQAQADLFPRVYQRLKAIASSFLRAERGSHTLETAALVHEAYLQMVDQEKIDWRERAQFFALSARFMRRILVDHARRHGSQRRGGGLCQLALDEVRDGDLAIAPQVEAVDEALRDLAAHDPQQARLVELRYFGGLNRDEIAEVLQISSASVTRRWRLARAWLYRHLAQPS